MKTATTAFLAVFVISFVGIWGYAQQKNNTQARKIRELEERYIKLDKDYQSVVTTGEVMRKKLVRLELQRSEQAQQLEELKAAVLERDELKQKLAVRTHERDAVNAQFVQFSRELQSFASRVESVANAHGGTQGNGAPVAIPNAKTN